MPASTGSKPSRSRHRPAPSCPWHQDNGYTPLLPEEYVTCWLALDDAELDNGCLWVIPGSHRHGTVRHHGGAGPFRVGHDGPETDGVPVPVTRGSVLVFSSLLMHRSGPNHTDRSRRAWILQYCGAEARSALSGKLLDDRLLCATDGAGSTNPCASASSTSSPSSPTTTSAEQPTRVRDPCPIDRCGPRRDADVVGRWGRVVVCVAVAAACVVPAVRADRLPTPAECDAGGAELLTLGEAPGALAVCVPGGTYAGGNPTYPCGTILVAGVPLVGTPDDDPAADCDAVDPLADELRYRIALPPGYSTETKRRWPVLYLLPGGGGDEHSWETVTPIVPQLTAMGLIVVLPYGGLTFHVDWEEGGPARAYERAFVERLMPTIDAQYRTMRDRKHRAIAGFSRGGYGAMLTAARHPHLFGAAASASGVPDIFGPARTEQLYLYAATLV